MDPPTPPKADTADEWGLGNGEFGVRSSELGVGSWVLSIPPSPPKADMADEWGLGNGEFGVRSWEWGIGY